MAGKYGEDPNVVNELGHTVYPKWVQGQLVNNAQEEAELTGEPVKDDKNKSKKKSENWTE